MMKNLYIPKGKTLHYEALSCQNIVNDGTLKVDGTIHARSISGKGVVEAGTVSARSVAAVDLECASVIGETLAAERVCAAEVILSNSATVSCYLEAEYVEAPKLTMARHSIGKLKADDVTILPRKGRGIVRTLAAGFFRRLWLSLTRHIPMDAPYVQKEAPAADKERKAPAPDVPFQPPVLSVDAGLENDFEFKRLKALYLLLKESGYTLRITERVEPAAAPKADSTQAVPFPEAA